jgi:hypothetical protein
MKEGVMISEQVSIILWDEEVKIPYPDSYRKKHPVNHFPKSKEPIPLSVKSEGADHGS